MAACSYSALREKEVINLCDGRRLGYVCDLALDLGCGRVTAIVVPGEASLFGFGRTGAITVPWEKIETIGEDAILVRVDVNACAPCEGKRGRK